MELWYNACCLWKWAHFFVAFFGVYLLRNTLSRCGKPRSCTSLYTPSAFPRAPRLACNFTPKAPHTRAFASQYHLALLRITHGSPSKREARYNCSRKQNRILRPRPTFAHTCAYGERVNAARYYVAIAPQRENTRSAAGAPAGCLSKSRRFFPSVREKSVSIIFSLYSPSRL